MHLVVLIPVTSITCIIADLTKRGPQLRAIYNDAYIPLMGNKHPASLGAGFDGIWAEVGAVVIPVFDRARTTRKAAILPDMGLVIKRDHFAEETFFEATMVPLVSQSGLVSGIYNSCAEKTRQKLSDRRTQMLNRISAPSDRFTSTSVYAHIAARLDANNYDIPFALLYKIETEFTDGNHELTLQSSIGLSQADEFLSLPTKLHDNVGFMPFFRAVERQPVTTTIDKLVGDIDWKNVEWKGHGQAAQCFSTLPILSADHLYGYAVVGSNPLRPIDDDYDQFMIDLQRHITTAVVASTSVEESMIRSARLEAQLAERERQIRYMAQHADICMMQLNPNGTLMWANERYHSVVNQGNETTPKQTFIPEDQLIADDRPHATEAWAQVLQGQRPDTTELRLQRLYTPPIGNRVPSTILLSAFPYMEQGQVKSVMACMSDVSQLKWAESWQAQLAHDAKEAKRQQSEFTDAISHEVRNPLSAILQLADGITHSRDELFEPTVQDCMDRLSETVEAAQTIISCAKHQKRIVDDVLTLSKLNLTSITLSPVPSQPDNLVQETYRMFEAEAAAHSIALKVTQDDSLRKHVPGRLMCDPLRLTQVLINLISNAIKFTKQESYRAVSITYGAALSDPYPAFPPQVVWASPEKNSMEDRIQGQDWGDGQPVYLTFAVEDSGPGMTPAEMNHIFDRFQQASARTSIKYGGSGLGLFICHDLIRKQGGRIGAMSTPRHGSTFVFYTMARLVTSPPEQVSTGVSTINDSDQTIRSGVRPVVASVPIRTNPTPNSASQVPFRCDFHLLLVEDNMINQQILRRQLVKSGCTVHVANHGVEALTFLRSCALWARDGGQGPRIDVILMDWEMPVMDGLTCTQEIRSLEKNGCFTSHPEIIAVTANARPEQVQVAKDAGVDELMPKPFTVKQLLGLITHRLGT